MIIAGQSLVKILQTADDSDFALQLATKMEYLMLLKGHTTIGYCKAIVAPTGPAGAGFVPRGVSYNQFVLLELKTLPRCPAKAALHTSSRCFLIKLS